MIWFNNDIPVNSLLFQSKTFGLDKSRCILCRNGVHSIQYGTLNKSTIDTSLLIHNQYHIFADQLKLIFQNTCVLVLKTKVGLIFYLLTLLSWCRKICIFYIYFCCLKCINGNWDTERCEYWILKYVFIL